MSTPPIPLDPATVRELARQLEERLHALETYGAGGCFTCHEAEARAFLGRLRRMVAASERTP